MFCCLVLVIMSLGVMPSERSPTVLAQCSAVCCVVCCGQQMLPPVTDVNPQGKTATPDYLNIYQYYGG